MAHEVIHFEDEKLVALVLDYKLAAAVGFLLGECASVCSVTNPLYDALLRVKQVEEVVEKLADKADDIKDEFGSPCYNFSKVLK